MRYPFDKYRLGTKYGVKGTSWKCGWHSGQDFLSANYGGDGVIYPLYAGQVLKVTNSGSYGNCVYVQHPDGYITLYAHMRQVYVKPGMAVDEQTALGVEGATGNAKGKHLHVEVHKGAYRYPASIDPLAFIQNRIGDDEEMDAAGFEKLMNEYRQKLRDNDSSAYSAQARQWAVESDLVAGGEALPNGQPNYMWEDLLTREQLVTVLFRFAQLMGKA